MELEDLRLAAGMTQRELADKLDVHQAAVSNWERGINAPLPKYRKKICKIFKCSDADITSRV